MIAPARLPSRILMTADTVGGVWTFALELAEALGEHGIEVVLATMGRLASPEQRREAQAVTNLELYESEYRLPWMDEPWDEVQLARQWLLRLTERTSPDLVHLNEPVFGSSAWSVPVVAVAHSCVVSWWQSVHGESPPPEWDRYRAAMTEGLHGVDAVVAPSYWMLSSLRQNYRIGSGRVILNGRNPRGLAPRKKEAFVFAAGRLWDPAKNLLALQEIAADLPWPIYVAGDHCHPGREDSVSAQRLHLLGPLPAAEVATWLRWAGIYAFPARYEPFGLSVLEAALAGCALVLGDVPTLRELWDGCALFVAPDDAGTLRLAVEGLIEAPILRNALAMRARRRALTLTPQRMAAAYLELYRDLFSKRSSVGEEQACAS